MAEREGFDPRVIYVAASANYVAAWRLRLDNRRPISDMWRIMVRIVSVICVLLFTPPVWAEQGDDLAQDFLDAMYARGDGVQQDD